MIAAAARTRLGSYRQTPGRDLALCLHGRHRLAVQNCSVPFCTRLHKSTQSQSSDVCRGRPAELAVTGARHGRVTRAGESPKLGVGWGSRNVLLHR